jgi:hypothetical protein
MGSRGRGCMVVGFTISVESVPITTTVVSSNLVHGEVFSIQRYVIKIVSELQQVGCFLWVLRLLRKNEMLKMTINTINQAKHIVYIAFLEFVETSQHP